MATPNAARAPTLGQRSNGPRNVFLTALATLAIAAGCVQATVPIATPVLGTSTSTDGRENDPEIPAYQGERFLPPVPSAGGVVAAMTNEAATIGVDVLDAGGNAMDAAIAAALADGVVRPYFCGIGGSGILVYRSAGGDVVALDFEPAIPERLTAEFISQVRRSVENVTFKGHRVVGVPGAVAGFYEAHQRFGQLAWRDLIMPTHATASDRAEGLARNGITVDRNYTFFTAVSQLPIAPFPETRKNFLVGGVAPYPEGSILTQPHLARTLADIAREGPAVFYEGWIAEAIAVDMTGASTSTDKDAFALRWPSGTGDEGLITLEDLAAYRPAWRKPEHVAYRGANVYTAPAPSGGLLVAQMLTILEGFPLGEDDADPFPGDPIGDRDWRILSNNSYHTLAEVEKIAWRDWIRNVGDPAHVDVPSTRLLSPHYGAMRRAEITWKAADFHLIDPHEGTCHVSVVDRHNNAVSLTYSIGGPYGSMVMAPNTGFVLNSQLYPEQLANETWVNSRPLPGSHVALAHSPSIVVQNGRPILVTGAAGGDLIPMGVLQSIVNVLDFGMGIAHALDAPILEAVWGSLYNDNCTGKLVLEAIDKNATIKGHSRIHEATQHELALRWGNADETRVMCRADPGANWLNGFDDYIGTTLMPRVVGFDPDTHERVGAGNPRELGRTFGDNLGGYSHLGVQAQKA